MGSKAPRVTGPSDETSDRTPHFNSHPPKANILGWLVGGLLLVGLVIIATHAAEAERFAALLREARPAWLLVALILQVGTYICAARVLQRTLAQYSVRLSLSGLIPLGLAKLFSDQAVPSAGLSGTLLTIRGLQRRGVSRGVSVGAMLTGLVAYYIAYFLIVAAALIMLWRRAELTRTVVSIATVFCIVVAMLPIVLLWLRDRAIRHLPTWIERLPPVREALQALAEAPPDLLRYPRLIAEITLLQVAVFLLDAGTLGTMLVALAAPAAPDIVLASFVVASVVATLGWVPGGIGTFEATCVAMLHWNGVALEAAIASTLLLRGFTFWLPMIPGLWLARRELRANR